MAGTTSRTEDTRDTRAPDAVGASLSATTISGLYATHGSIPGLVELAAAIDEGTSTASIGAQGDELRLDVDGPSPQMVASGTVPLSALQRVHWIASLTAAGAGRYTGGIWYKDPVASAFAYTNVEVHVSSGATLLRHAKVTFSGGGLPDRTRLFHYKSPYFHKVEFEFDSESGVAPVLEIATRAHPTCPPALPAENLSIQTVFRRAGFDVRNSRGHSELPVTGTPGPGVGGQWSDSEMHDAMSVYWSRFANQSQWALWVLFARQHEFGNGLGGIMFDDIGPNHRQGTALFYDSFISELPTGDPEADAWVARMRFWTAVHEMGHAFNLAHSWQKALGTPWIPLANEPLAMSFMNYPHSSSFANPEAFFTGFEHRFSNPELLFMRHAPSRFVQMGNAAWFDNHGLRDIATHPSPPLSLELRVNRGTAIYEFLEPVTAELKLKNISNEPQLIDENVLKTLDGITIVMKRQGGEAREYAPYARYCMRRKTQVLNAGESIYDSVFLSAGLNGADLAEPGRYTAYAVLHTAAGAIVSPPLSLRVRTPGSFEEERLAQDLFSDEVGRVLAFDGSRVMNTANDTLRAAIDEFPSSRIARHAIVALNRPLAEPRRVLSVAEGSSTRMASAASIEGQIEFKAGDADRACRALEGALTKDSDIAAQTLGHIDLKYYADTLTEIVAEDSRADAARIQNSLYDILSARSVAPHVLDSIDAKRRQLGAAAASRR